MPPRDDLIAMIIWSLREVLGLIKDALWIVVLAAIIYYGYGVISALNEFSDKLDKLGLN